MQSWKWSKALHPWSSGRGKLVSIAIIQSLPRHIALVQTGSGEEPGISVFTDVKWSSEEEGKINSLPWYQSPAQRPAHHSLPAGPLCHILLRCGCSVPWFSQSVPKPAAVAPTHTPAAGTAVLRLPSLSLALCLKEKCWAEWEKNSVLTLIFFIVEVCLEGRRILRQAEWGTT